MLSRCPRWLEKKYKRYHGAQGKEKTPQLAMSWGVQKFFCTLDISSCSEGHHTTDNGSKSRYFAYPGEDFIRYRIRYSSGRYKADHRGVRPFLPSFLPSSLYSNDVEVL